MMPAQADQLDGEPEHHQRRRDLEPALELGVAHGFSLGHFGSASTCATSCTVAWQPPATHDLRLARMSVSSLLCGTASTNERAPSWQCRHSRLSYGLYSASVFGMVPRY